MRLQLRLRFELNRQLQADNGISLADFDVLDTDVRTSANELKMAASLVENLSAEFTPDKFSDEYQAQLKELIAAKLEQGDALDTAATFDEEDAGEPEGGQVVEQADIARRQRLAKPPPTDDEVEGEA